MSAPQDLLDRITGPEPPPFALLHRPEVAGPGTIEILAGQVRAVGALQGISLPDADTPGTPRPDVLALIPYRQIAERGFACPDDGTPLLVMTVDEHVTRPAAEVLARIAPRPARLSGGHFDADDDAYAEVVRRVVACEIGAGEGANFVIRRSYVADIADDIAGQALSFFARLLRQETSAYWTFIVHTGPATLVGATPERHVTLDGGVAAMTPVSGTYRYPPAGPDLPGVMEFLADRKEADELYMVVDEELKMMAGVCADGGRANGPYLREMARVAHTEYVISGRSDLDPREVLRRTMFAPTVTGSPLENACRVIARYEPQGRGYYSGVIALIGRDAAGQRTLDSGILIRTAEISGERLRIGVGATLVRHSRPAAEAAETRAKAAGLLAALADRPAPLAQHPAVRAALSERNATIAPFWTDGPAPATDPALDGRRVLVIDAEDDFTAMLSHQLRSLGLAVTIRRHDERYRIDSHDLVVCGPGPGDPRDTAHPKIASLRGAVATLLTRRRPFLAVCLSHQVLSMQLGLPLVRREVPNQGVQREIDLFGRPELVGFYNSYAARSPADVVRREGIGTVRVSRDPDTGEVHALRGPRFASMQFHSESLLTRDGVRIIAAAMKEVLAP